MMNGDFYSIVFLLKERETVIKKIVTDLDKYDYSVKLLILESMYQSDKSIISRFKSGQQLRFGNIVYLNTYPLRKIDLKIETMIKSPVEGTREYLQVCRRRCNYYPKAISKLKQALLLSKQMTTNTQREQ